MTLRTNVTLAAIIAITAAAAIAVPVLAGGDKVAFPADYGKGVVYMTLDRAENKQVREYYTSQESPLGDTKRLPCRFGSGGSRRHSRGISAVKSARAELLCSGPRRSMLPRSMLGRSMFGRSM